MSNINKYSTIHEIIEYGNELEISHSKLHFKERINIGDTKVTLNTTPLYHQYMHIITSDLLTVQLDQKDFDRYVYKPKLYCYEKYGNMELWSLLLAVNNMMSIQDFKVKKFKIMNPSTIFTTLNNILLLEKKFIDLNEDEINE